MTNKDRGDLWGSFYHHHPSTRSIYIVIKPTECVHFSSPLISGLIFGFADLLAFVKYTVFMRIELF